MLARLKKAFSLFGTTSAPTIVTLGLPTLTLGTLPRTRINFAADVGDGLGSSVLMSPVKWLQRTFPEAPFEVVRLGKNEDETVIGHPLTQLIKRPNAYYTGTALFSGTIYSWIRGNAYWFKKRKTRGNRDPFQDVTSEVEELWYVPHWLIKPAWPKDGSVFISHYEYSVGNRKPIEIPIENIVHFRNGIDPRNTRSGLDMIESEYREIVTDAEAANYSATILRNMGIPGVMISPEVIDPTQRIDEKSKEQRDAEVAEIQARTTGDKRGTPLVFSTPTKVQAFGFDPKQMDVTVIRNGNEARLCAALGIPSAVVGFTSGMDQTKVGATMQALKRMAWEGCLVPMQAGFGETIGHSLLPEFEGTPENFECWFNHRQVAAMQDNAMEKARAMEILVRAGIAPINAAQKETGLDVDESQAIYLRPITTVEVPVGQTRPLPDPNAVQQTPLPDIPKARFKAAADRRFLRVQARLEKLLQSDIAQLFTDESALVVKAYRQSVKAETKDDWLDGANSKLKNRWAEALAESIRKSIEAGWKLADAEIEDLVSFDMFDAQALEFATTQAGLKVKEISSTTVERVRGVIGKSVENGWSTEETTKELKNLYDGFSTTRALTIARTETSNAMNHGKHKAAEKTMEETGLDLERVWSSVNDDRTREAHAAADGQVRKMGEPFNVGGEELEYPGDPSGSAENTIQCRCTQIFQERES